MDGWKAFSVVLGLLVTVLSWAGKDQIGTMREAAKETNAKLDKLSAENAELTTALKLMSQQLAAAKDDERQDEMLSKHWRLHGWARDEINKLRFGQGLQPVAWPGLE